MTEHVLITGGAGFIGSRLARRLSSEGHRVTVLDSLIAQVHGDDPGTTSPLLRSLDGIATVIQGSVTSSDALARALSDVTAVVHLAAETGTGQSMYEIDRYVEVNTGGTAKLLDLLANTEHSVRRIVIASSRSIYGEGAYRTSDGRVVYPPHRADAAMAAGDFDVHVEGEGEGRLELIPTDESAKLHPSSVYGITKQMQEALIMTVAPTIGIEPVALRYQNVYGPGQSLKNPYTGILSIFSTLIRQGKEINIFEDGLESRDFVYIDDVVEATYLATTSPAAAGGVFNVGSGVATTVLDVVEALTEAYGRDIPTRVSGNYRLGDIRHNVADTTRLREVLGFTPSVPFAEGVKRFAEWVLTEPVEGDNYQKSLDEMAAKNLLK
ncbi:NAD-dependent epimerase/dehydratase family protein [Microbacterium radiodurans]|uniref:NAD-dependent epimerase/dehydratase family protein n=1 Tax=Microbacterium radiodurans TaxID=661398 RepID=A0A5J5IQW6_9MICO|nr:NAD-dependent epimerase/dehydratase family protein [Microbacterium radiodurans]KAA9085090.1 NAD-dependent epimerase/dehydratase family protein [Microbacterium radiodurans]